MAICSLSMRAQAVQTPTIDLYDTNMMNMYAWSYAQTYHARKQNYEYYVGKAFDAAKNEQWPYVITLVSNALNTGFWNADLYWLRGIAYENCGYLKDAKKDYKRSKRKGSSYAASSLARLKEKMKKQK